MKNNSPPSLSSSRRKWLAWGLVLTATAHAAPGTFTLQPATLTVAPNAAFTLQLRADSGTHKLGAYKVEVSFNPARLQVNTTTPFVAGTNALANNFANPNNTTGKLLLNGFDPNGKAAGANLHLVTLNFKALATTGSVPVGLKALIITNELATAIGTLTGVGSAVTVQTANLPTATTSAATTITASSAKLNGVVNNGGATTTVSFDLGLTTTYGKSIAAVPAIIVGVATNTPVSAIATGLNCNTLYHYRVKAVNSAGTKLGANASFKTLTCSNVDFVVASIALTPVAPTVNKTFNATVTVKNQGTVTADGKNLDVWPHLTTIPGCGAIGAKRLSVGSLAAGTTKSLTFTGLNAGTAAGSKMFRAFVDSGCGTPETRKDNNQLTLVYPVNGTAPAADFAITNIVLTPAAPVPNGKFTAAVTVKNQGTVAGDGKFLDVWNHQPVNQACGATGTNRVAVGTLTVGQSKTFNITNLPAGTAGAKTLRVFVDSGCGTAEINEGNNQIIKGYTVQ